jgi:hypothetical protein
LQSKQGFFVEFVSTQQISVVTEITQEPTQPPQRFGGAIDPASQGMAKVLFWLKNCEAQEVKRSGGMPMVKSSIYTDEKDTFELIGAVSAFTMQAWNMACHEVTSCDLE